MVSTMRRSSMSSDGRDPRLFGVGSEYAGG